MTSSKASIQCINAYCSSCSRITLHFIKNVIDEEALTCLECPGHMVLLDMIEALDYIQLGNEDT